MASLEYPVIIEPLPQNEGGGFVALVPDLPGCMSDFWLGTFEASDEAAAMEKAAAEFKVPAKRLMAVSR